MFKRYANRTFAGNRRAFAMLSCFEIALSILLVWGRPLDLSESPRLWSTSSRTTTPTSIEWLNTQPVSTPPTNLAVDSYSVIPYIPSVGVLGYPHYPQACYRSVS